MGEKDITEKILEAFEDVFADIVNVLLFDGKRIINEQDLVDALPRSYYKADGKIHEMERDVAKRWKKGNIRIATLGFENQTDIDADMPLRVIGYDGAEYRAQLLPDNLESPRYPVVTLVLYFGAKDWTAPLNLKERLDIPPEFDKFVSDYHINLFEISNLDRGTVDKFQSDFRIVADYFVQKKQNGNYIPDSQEMKHIQETLQLLSVMTGDNRFEEVCNTSKKGECRRMCDVLDKIENKGREEGLEQGRQEGLEQGREEGLEQGRQEGLEQGREEGLQEGRQEGLEQGREQGMDKLAYLTQQLLKQNRLEDINKIADDKSYRQELLKEFHLD